MEEFELPADLTALSVTELDELLAKAREYASTVLTNSPNDVDALTNARNAFEAINAEKTAREQAETQSAALRDELAAAIAEPVVPADDDETNDDASAATVAEPQAVTAAVGTPRTTSGAPALIRNRSTLDAPAPGTPQGGATMITAPDIPGVASGQALTSFADAAKALEARLRSYPDPRSRGSFKGAKPAKSARVNRPSPTAVGRNARQIDLDGRSYARHSGIMLQRNFSDELTVKTGSEQEVYDVTKFASSEKRLPGGSLLKSAKAQIEAGRALTAAVGWCAPSENIYNLCDLSSLDGLLDLPELQADRGGFNLPEDGGPDFSVVWNGIGDEGDVILTEYDIINGAIKECFDIPCPDFVDVRLDAAYLCLTGSLLQRRTYPEAVALFTQESLKALAHKINASVIARIVAQSGSPVVIPADASGEDAASGIMNAVDLAVQDIKYSQRMSRDQNLEVVFPYWALNQIRAAMSRRYGIGRLDVTDREIFDWFEIRGAMPRFVYDWQDAYTGLQTGPGGAVPLTALPTTVNFAIYPAGTWTKIVQPVVNLDTIYDNAMLTTNEYTAVFAEDGFNVIQTCPVSRVYTAQADPSGVVGCCP